MMGNGKLLGHRFLNLSILLLKNSSLQPNLLRLMIMNKLSKEWYKPRLNGRKLQCRKEDKLLDKSEWLLEKKNKHLAFLYLWKWVRLSRKVLEKCKKQLTFVIWLVDFLDRSGKDLFNLSGSIFNS